MPLVVREGCRQDAADLARLVTELGYPVGPDELWSRIEKMPPPLYHTLVAVNETRVVGFIGLLSLAVYEHAKPVGWILALCVAFDHRGQGVGTALLAAAENYFRKVGVIDIRLHSGLQRDGAHRFYEKMGFDKSGYRFKKTLG
jgi:GNAT superfamily N-acetyltransferase